MSKRPGAGYLIKRPLHFIFLLDCSGSMVDHRINSLNQAVRSLIPHLQDFAQKNPAVNILIRIIAFSDSAYWHVPEPTPIKSFSLDNPLEAKKDSIASIGSAILLLKKELDILLETAKGLIPPVFVLVSNGISTDSYSYYINKLIENPIAKKALRVSISVGNEADKEELAKFLSPGMKELRVIEANNYERLISIINWWAAPADVVKIVSDNKNSEMCTENLDDGDEIW